MRQVSPQWKGSSRKSRLPHNWHQIRKRVFAEKGHYCLWQMNNGSYCGAYANQVDHIVPGDDHSITNLQPLCEDHHKIKSSSEGWEAFRKARAMTAKRVNNQFGWQEDHPGKNPKQPFKHPWQT